MVFEAWIRTRFGGGAVNINILRPALVSLSVIAFLFVGSSWRRILMPSQLSSAIDQALVPGERLERMLKVTTLSFLVSVRGHFR
jgi:hypothetical protein